MNCGQFSNRCSPSISIPTALEVDDHVFLIAIVPMQSSLSYEPDANGKRWTRPSCVRIRRRTIAFKSGCKQASFSNSGKLVSSNSMNCVALIGIGSQWTGR